MPTPSNHRPIDRTGRALVAALVAGVAALALMASVGHQSARADTQASTPPGLVSSYLVDTVPTVPMIDLSVPSAATALEHASGGQMEPTATF